MLFTVCTAYGRCPSDSVKVYFRVGYRQFDLNISENRSQVAAFIDKIREADAADNIDRLVVRAYASPDGYYYSNARLARYRCDAIVNYIIDSTGIRRDLIQAFPGGIAWKELRNMVASRPEVPLREKILEILDNTPVWVFDSSGRVIDGRKKQLMELAAGVPYRWMYDNIFPELRNAVAVQVYLKSDSSDGQEQHDNHLVIGSVQCDNQKLAENQKDSLGFSDKQELKDSTEFSDNRKRNDTLGHHDAAEIAYSKNLLECRELNDSQELADKRDLKDNRVQKDCRESENNHVMAENPEQCSSHDVKVSRELNDSRTPETQAIPSHRFALKTNMLFDALLIPNIGAEFYLGKDLSVYGEWMYAWWSNNNLHRYYRIYGGDLGLRWWFGKRAHEKPLTGHHVGVYGGVFTFDFEFGGRGYLGGLPGGNIFDSCFINGGIEYGYSLPVSKHLNIDFSLGAGYTSGKYMEYIPDGFEHGYLWQATKRFGWVGPTKAEISLVWLLGRGNGNTKKGGEK